MGTFDCIRIAATAMSRLEPTATGERRAIVNMTSVAAFDGQIGQAAYSSSKGGVVGLTSRWPVIWPPSGFGQHRARPDRHPIYGEGEHAEAFKAKLGQSVLFPHRLGKPEELASMVIELITNSYMNAEVVASTAASGCPQAAVGSVRVWPYQLPVGLRRPAAP